MGIATLLSVALFAVGAVVLAVVIGLRKYQIGKSWRLLIGVVAVLALVGVTFVLSRTASVSSAHVALHSGATVLSGATGTPSPKDNHAPIVPTSPSSSSAVSKPTPTPKGNHAPAPEATPHLPSPAAAATPLPVPPQQSTQSQQPIQSSSIPGGLWVSPANGAQVGDDLTISAQAYPTYAGDPGISHVNFTSWYNGAWHVICPVYSPSYSNVYQCHWHLAGLIQPGWVTISFDVYNTANQANYAPNGMHSIDYVPPPPGGLWVSPANNATVGDDLTISAQAYPTNAGDPGIWYVNFTGWYNGAWHVMCSDFAPSYSNVYTCHWHLAGLIQPGWVTISFDVYDVIGHTNYAPNGTHNIYYSPPPPGGLWVSPANNATVGDDLTISASAYPTYAGDPAISHVNFTGWYNGAWHVICPVYSPSYSNVYTCHWHLAGLIQPGWVTISFDVYDVIGHTNYAPNGTHNIDYVPPLPGGVWVTPANGAQVGDGAVLKASAYPANSGDPAVDHVHFTAYYSGSWHILCSVHAPTYGNVYECGWMLKGLISPGAVTISFDVYDVAGRHKYEPNGWHSINFVPGTSKSTTAIAWAMTELGNQELNGQCEVFVERAFGTQYKFLTAQKAADNLHPTTATTPPVGALVFFKYFNPTDNAWDGHVGIYIGNNQFISATNSGVKIYYMDYWNAHVGSYEGWAAAPSTWPGK